MGLRFVLAIVATVVVCGGSSLCVGAEVGIGSHFKGPVGIQLYSLRDEFAKDVPGTLDKVKAFGFKSVELAGTYGLKPEEFKKLLDARGLSAVSGHWGFGQFRDALPQVVAEAKTFGVKYAGCAWIDHQDDFDEAECREAIAVFNKAGEELAKHGITFFYHTHGYEFVPHDKGTLYALLA